MPVAVLNWSAAKYKFTLGIGSLAVTAGMAELWRPHLPVWVVMVVAALPVAVFVLVTPDVVPARLVRVCQVFASAWYLASAAAVSAGLWAKPDLPKGWAIFPLFCAVGAVPCVLVLSRAVHGR